MRSFLFKLLFLFAFILFSIGGAFADDIGISSVVFDDSSAFLTVNAQDNFEFSSDSVKLIVVSDENKAYFDIPNAILKCPKKDIIADNSPIKEIIVSQFSTDPNIVRVVLHFNEQFDPNNIRLKKFNNTIFVQFYYPNLANYYFQKIFSDDKPDSFYVDTSIQYKIPANKNNVFDQINSSFGIQNNDDEFVLSNEDLILNTKYYLDNVKFKGVIPLFTGTGSINISKPIYLTNPSRVAFDLRNSIVNPSIRNNEIEFAPNETIKIGQFDKNTVRIVITSSDPEKFVPVVYPDAQRLVILDTKNISPSNMYSTDVGMTSVSLEKSDNYNYGVKFVFNKPVLTGITRSSKQLDLYLYNLSNYSDIKAELINSPFSNLSVSQLKSNGIKLSLNTDNIKNADVFVGSDGKTLRIKSKLLKPYEQPVIAPIEPVITDIPVYVPHKDGKHYVLIDAGHGGSDVGATRNNIYEKDITLDMAKRVEKILKSRKDFVVAMTRDSDKTVSLQERVDISEVFNPDIFISIHVNSSNSDSPYGLETHYYKENSLMLAKCVHASMLNNISSKDRGLFKSKFYVINHTTAPAILVETGFISNSGERAQLVTESRKNATAKAIVEGIDEYFKAQ